MRLETPRFGLIEVPDDTIYTFPQGVPGFPTLHRYAILEAKGCEPFRWLQSIEQPVTAFLVTDPLQVCPEYRIEVTREEIGLIALNNLDTGFVLVILSVPADPNQMTANLRAPLVFNPEQRLGRQLILSRSEWPVRWRVFESSGSAAAPAEAPRA